MRASELTFEFLDDLALGVARRRAIPEEHLRQRSVERLGPLVELLAFDRIGLLPLSALPRCAVGQLLGRALVSREVNQGSHIVSDAARVGFVLTHRNPMNDDQTQWVAFCRKAQEAAELSLPKPLAQGLIGAMREIEENIHLHSERPEDGIIGYRGTEQEFEFVVGDSGVGILKSLRTSPDYVHLDDAGSAIKTALSDGESRLRYTKPDRGFGFRDLFVGLANLNGQLRFRSGDHALTIDGTSPSLMTARLSQKVEIPGFLASVVVGGITPRLTVH